MKKLFLIFFLLSLAVVPLIAQHASLTIGDLYIHQFKDGIKSPGGDGSCQYGEFRIILGSNKNNFGIGGFINGVLVNTSLNNFTYRESSIAIGLALDSWGEANYSHNYYWWTDVGPKFMTAQGSNDFVDIKKSAMTFYVMSGLVISDLSDNYWFSDHKFMVTETELNRLDPGNKNDLSLRYEATIRKFYTGIYIEPRLILSYENQGFQTDYVGGGVGLTFSVFKDWKREILSINCREVSSLQHFGHQPTLYGEINLDVMNLFLILNRNSQKK
jgi:hypothetical protein